MLATVDRPWSAYATGPFVLVTLSTEHDVSAGSEQWQWLNATLARVNRTASPWVLLGAHRPMYVDSVYASDSAAQRGRGPSTADIPVMSALQAAVEPLTMRHKVSLALYGHNHAVQRLTPAYRNASVQASAAARRADGAATRRFDRPRATLHMVVGTGGAGFTKNCAAAVGGGVAPPPWSERCFFQWGFLLVRARSATVLELDWLDGSSGVAEERIDLVQDLEQEWADAAGAAAQVRDVRLAVGLAVGGALVALAAAAAARAALRRRAERSRAGGELEAASLIHYPATSGASAA